MEPSQPKFLDPCQEAVATLYTYLDGELTDDRRQQIQNHLDDCAPCLDKYDFEAELKVVIAKRCRDEVPESLRKRVAEAIFAEGTEPGDSSGGPGGE